jgi:hypothetical protein
LTARDTRGFKQSIHKPKIKRRRFGMAAEELSPKRRSRRERVQTPKAVELNRKRRETHGQDGSSEDETEDTIEVGEVAPTAPQLKRTTETSAFLKDRVVATKI